MTSAGNGLPHERVALSREPLDPEAVTAQVAGSTRVGGSVCFVGRVREWTGGRQTVELEYEAYEPMALRELTRLVELAEQRWPGLALAVVHRLGVLRPGEAAVVVAAGAPHREEAFEACRWAIDRLKEEVPIWKRERYADGSQEWVGLGGTREQPGPASPAGPVTGPPERPAPEAG